MRYRIRTGTCDHYSDEPCAVCAADMARPPASPSYHPFKAGFYEHVSYEGVYAETPEQLKKACEENGCYSSYLENSIHGGRIGKIKEI